MTPWWVFYEMESRRRASLEGPCGNGSMVYQVWPPLPIHLRSWKRAGA